MCEISVRVWADETTVAAMLCLLINYGRFTVIGVIRQRMLKMERRGKNVNEFRHWRNMATSFSCGGCFCFSFAFFSLYLFLLLLLLHLNRSLIGYFTLTEHKHSNAQMESVYYSLATIVFAKDCVRARSLFLFPSAPPPPPPDPSKGWKGTRSSRNFSFDCSESGGERLFHFMAGQ